MRTSFTKVRLDPVTLQVDPGDQTFSASTGSLTHGQTPVASMPYGAAMDCVDAASTTGVANLDFTGLPFVAAPNQFTVSGYQPNGTTTYGGGGRTVDLTGGGYCGWNTIDGANPLFLIKPIQLVYAP